LIEKNSKIGAARRQILSLKCTNFDFRWCSASDPAGGAYSCGTQMYLRAPTSKGKERRGNRGKEGRKRREEGRKGENDLTHPLSQIPGYATVVAYLFRV